MSDQNQGGSQVPLENILNSKPHGGSGIYTLSRIFDHLSLEGAEGHQFPVQAKIILLTMILCFTAYAMYTISQSFIDTIILAFLLGVAYVNSRQRFIKFCRNSKAQIQDKDTKMKTFIESVYCIVLIIAIPWISNQFSDQTEYNSWGQLYRAKINIQLFNRIQQSFFKTNNIIKFLQIYLICKIFYNIFGDLIQRLFYYFKGLISKHLLEPINPDHPQTKTEIKERIRQFLHKLFGVLFILTLCVLLVILAGIVFEFSGMINSAGKAIQKYNNCTFYSLEHGSNIKHCTDVITGSLKPYLYYVQYAGLTQPTRTISANVQKRSLKLKNFTLLQYKKEICLVYQMIKEYSPTAIDKFLNIQATKEYLTTILKNLLKLIAVTSDTLFSITTFISIFIITIISYTPDKQHLGIFGKNQSKLVQEVTNLISDYAIVTFKHIVLSMAIFQIFQFSQVNIILSLLIGVITLFPFISVTMIMILFSVIKYYFSRQNDYIALLSSIICCIIFYIGSRNIFNNHFNKIDFNKALIGLSAVFGLYRFGVAGIFYGPLTILLFQCAYEALSKCKP